MAEWVVNYVNGIGMINYLKVLQIIDFRDDPPYGLGSQSDEKQSCSPR